MGNAAFLAPFFNVILLILSIIQWIVVVWVVLSWILFAASHTSFRWRHPGGFRFLETLNDIFGRMALPFLRPIRRWLRRFNTAGIDWSPLVLLVIIYFIRELLVVLFNRILM
jgi:YggT family protein